MSRLARYSPALMIVIFTIVSMVVVPRYGRSDNWGPFSAWYLFVDICSDCINDMFVRHGDETLVFSSAAENLIDHADSLTIFYLLQTGNFAGNRDFRNTSEYLRIKALLEDNQLAPLQICKVQTKFRQYMLMPKEERGKLCAPITD